MKTPKEKITNIYDIAGKLGFIPKKPLQIILDDINVYWVYFRWKSDEECMIHRDSTDEEIYKAFTKFIYREGKRTALKKIRTPKLIIKRTGSFILTTTIINNINKIIIYRTIYK